MKKCLITLGALAVSVLSFGQSAYDALTLNNADPVMGTARYSSMAGAFGAFGGNVSVAKDNPAGLGVYKRCDITFTPSFYLDNDNDFGLSFDNFGAVINFQGRKGREHGYITSSLGIIYNRTRNFSRYSVANNLSCNTSLSDMMSSVYASDNIFNNANELGLLTTDAEGNYVSNFSTASSIDKNVRYQESGHAGTWDITYGLNISNRVYVGASLGIASINYSQKSMYTETSQNDKSEEFFLDNYYRADAVGVNFKAGAIVKATDFLRVGFAIHTPTLYDVDEQYSIDFDYRNQYPGNTEIEYQAYKYEMTSPFKLQGSLGFVITKRALIGIEYGLEDYKTIKLKTEGTKIQNECDLINEVFKPSHQLKVGAEFKIIPEFAVRLGYAHVSSPIDKIDETSAENMFWFRSLSIPQQTNYFTGGVGYEGECFYCDLSYVQKVQSSCFYEMLPLSESAWDLDLKNHTVAFTAGWRF